MAGIHNAQRQPSGGGKGCLRRGQTALPSASARLTIAKLHGVGSIFAAVPKGAPACVGGHVILVVGLAFEARIAAGTGGACHLQWGRSRLGGTKAALEP